MNDLAHERPESFGRYLLYPAIARGGMATVHTARLVGAEGFSRLVAAKRLHPQYTDDPEFVTMFHDEACIASRIHHPNVVPVLDVVTSGNELILVQEYVHGVPLSQLAKVAHVTEVPIAVDVAVAVIVGVLAGLHAAHEVRDEAGASLEIVHRDVSPANVMISVDGVPRLLDFGIAKATTSTHHTREGVFKGKLAYMAPEQLRMEPVDRRLDVYATGVMAWELLVNRRIYDGRHEVAFVTAVMNGEIPSVIGALASQRESIDDARWASLVALEPIITRAMADRADERYATAEEMMRALLEICAPASSMALSGWVREAGAEFLDKRQRSLAATEESWRRTSLFTPGSGTQPVSSSSAIALSVAPPRGRIAKHSRALPFVVAAGFALAGLLGGLLRSGAEPAPVQPADVAPAAVSTEAAPATQVAPAAMPTAAAAALASATPSASSTAAPPPRAFHFSPPPPAPVARAPVFTRPTPPAPAAIPNGASPSSASTPTKSDCNPPFFFEGTKKIFKPSCL